MKEYSKNSGEEGEGTLKIAMEQKKEKSFHSRVDDPLTTFLIKSVLLLFWIILFISQKEKYENILNFKHFHTLCEILEILQFHPFLLSDKINHE